MTIYVRFQVDTSDTGAWYRLVSSPDAGPGELLAVHIYPPEETISSPTRIVARGEECHWLRTEFEEDDVPDWVWARIAEYALTDERTD